MNSGDTIRTINYGGVFLTCISDEGMACTPMIKNHTLAYVSSGEIEINYHGDQTYLHKGDCFFIRRDHRISTIKRPYNGEQFRGIFLTFSRNFLRTFYNQIDKKDLPQDNKASTQENIILFEPRADMMSVFESLTPYYDQNILPDSKIIDLKQTEALYALLNADKKFYSILFDFTEPWKIDIMDFMEKNYMYNLSLEEIATFTGRSLATFKRDFAKINRLSPQKWLIKRRLEAAYDMLKIEGRKVSEVYEEVGFKNLAHFYYAFKQQYGYSPRK